MKNLLLASFLFFSLHVSSQWTTPDGNGHIKNTNSGHVAIGANAIDFVKFNVQSTTTSASQIPDWGWWNLYSSARTTHTGPASKLWGSYFLTRLGSSGSLEEMISVNADIGIDNNAGGSVTDAYGVKVNMFQRSGTITNGYGLFIDDIEATNQYGIYQAGTNDKNYFAGDVGVGAETFDGVSFFVKSDATNTSEIPSYGLWGLFSYSSWSGSSATSGSVYGGRLISLNNHSGTLQNSIGIETTAGNESSGNGTVTNAYGIKTGVDKGNGTVSNGYGLYINDIAATNQYGVYQVGANDKNYFAGSIAIGTNDPKGYKLAVNGNAIATEIKVKTFGTWPDYVFNKDYNLTDLEEVEEYIKVNGHLSNIPSAAEVKENEGIELGEMNAKLLQKIEELTLYTIEQEKKIAKLENLVEQIINDKK